MITTYFCKKGGVGKTTVLGEHADYLASIGKKVLIISIDDQNSVFEMYGKFNEVYSSDANFLENALCEMISADEAAIKLRDNIYGMKTLNTDMLSKKLTLERAFERYFVNFIKSLDEKYDAVFIDLPPANCRTSEVIFDICKQIILIVELTKLGVNGLYNTIQYFVDCGIELNKIKYILPNGFSKNKSVPSVAMEEIVDIAKEHIPTVTILSPLPEKSSIQILQQKGVVVFDQKTPALSSYHKAQKKMLVEIFTELFKTIDM